MFEENHNTSKQSFLPRMIVATAMISLAYILLFMDPANYRATLQDEINALKPIIGKSESTLVINRATKMYQWAFIDTQTVASLEKMVTSGGLKGEDFWLKPLIRIVENLKLMFYQSSYRLSVFIHWFFLGLPLIFAMAADGYYKRKIKQYEFGVASANIFKIWLKAGVFAFFIIDIYFIFPAAGIFGVLLPPIMFLILGFSLRYALSNVSKIF
ncbi:MULTISPECIES: DUF4400 domain-containing protein [unclassified Pseudoalteromonas]|uniref:DUF4400 domain-containing protein n=1 Tax=unclassified Pseudoalteromonas TaxID=194690 RepID=UPI0003F8B1E3|nr:MULTISPECIES: DUF4400 domain-containing protein [unclassified Pseudoalteromonas]